MSAKGKVKAKKKGTATITATAADGSGKKATCKVTVKEASSSSSTAATVSVTSIALNATESALTVNTTKQLTATVSPSKVTTQKIAWSSSDSAVATVNEKGLVTAVAEGAATITAAATDGSGISATCLITVKGITVDSQTALEKALKSGTYTSVSVISDSLENLTIPEGDYSNTALIIDAPKAHIENYGVFKSVEIANIGNDTYVDRAHGNTIRYRAPHGHVRIADGASVAAIVIAPGAQAATIENDGDIAKFQITTPSNLVITGVSSQRSIETEISAEAQGSTITTNQALDATSQAEDVTVNLETGAEATTFAVDNTSQIPTVNGVGTVAVQVGESGLETVVANNTETQTATANVKGVVRNVQGDGLEGVQILVKLYGSTDVTKTLTTDEGGNYAVSDLPIGNYSMEFNVDGYQSAVQTVVLLGNAANTTVALPDIILAEGEGVGSISGVLRDAATGATVDSGLTVAIRSGVNNVSGTPVASTTTDENGTYSFSDLPVGAYTVQVVDNRGQDDVYVTNSFTVTVVEGQVTVPDRTMTYVLKDEQIRFVLEWGDEQSGACRDLDSHLVGPTPNGGQFHTWYSDKEYYYGTDEESNDISYDGLDVDDTTWEGPETTTIYVPVEGTYHFYVHDFCHLDSDDGDYMSRSQATVKVYSGNRLLATYAMPNEAGTLWDVCTYDSTTGSLNAVGTVSYWDTPEMVGVDAHAYYAEKLQSTIDEAQTIVDGMGAAAPESLTTALETAKSTLNDSDSTADQLRQQVSDLQDAMDGLTSGLWLEISGDDIDSFYWDSSEENKLVRYGTITGFTQTIPDYTVSVDEDSIYEIKDSDKSDYAQMITVTNSQGVTATYYVSYAVSSNATGIRNVSLVDEDDNDLIDEWDYELLDEDDADSDYVLTIWGYKAALLDADYAALQVTPRASGATCAISDSDRDGYDKKVVVTYGDASRTYYIEYRMSSSATSLRAVTLLDSNGDNVITGWSTEWIDDDDSDAYMLGLKGTKTELAERDYDDLTFTVYGEGATTEIADSDIAGYAKKLIVTCGDRTRVYYLTYTSMRVVGGSLTLDEAQDFAVDEGQEILYSFTAPETGSYVFETTGSSDTYGTLYDADMEELTANDDGDNGTNFQINYVLDEGQTYYLSVRGLSWDSASGSVSVTKNAAADSSDDAVDDE